MASYWGPFWPVLQSHLSFILFFVASLLSLPPRGLGFFCLSTYNRLCCRTQRSGLFLSALPTCTNVFRFHNIAALQGYHLKGLSERSPSHWDLKSTLRHPLLRGRKREDIAPPRIVVCFFCAPLQDVCVLSFSRASTSDDLCLHSKTVSSTSRSLSFTLRSAARVRRIFIKVQP